MLLPVLLLLQVQAPLMTVADSATVMNQLRVTPAVARSPFVPLPVEVHDDRQERDHDDRARGAAISFGGAATMLTARHPLLPGSMYGGEVRIALSFPVPRVGFIVTAGRTQSGARANRSGSTCTGLIPPIPSCLPQPLEDKGSVELLTVGLSIRAIQLGRISLDVLGDYGRAHLASTVRGLERGGTLSAGQDDGSASVGLAIAWKPWTRKPLDIDVSASTGHFWPLQSRIAPDAYVPFERSIATRQLKLGIRWNAPLR